MTLNNIVNSHKLNSNTMTLKLSDGLFITAEAIVNIGRKSGINLQLTEVYTKDNLESLALIAGLLRQVVEKTAKASIEVTNN